MRCGWGPLSLALRLLLLARLVVPGDGNEGSRAGSCHCDKRFPPGSPPMERIRKLLKDYDRCGGYVRFQLEFQRQSWSVCGGSKDWWVTELTSCFDRSECGHAYSGRVVQQEHSPPPSTQIPESTEGAPAVTDTPAQTYLPLTLQSTQQPTLPVGTLSLDTKLIHSHETTTSSVGHSVQAGPEAGVNQKQLDENVGPTAGSRVMVPVLSLLGIVFFLIGALFYVVCKRRSKQSLQYSPDLQLQYISVASYSNSWAKNGSL
ncbi:C-X-C motif chemokine 16 [Myotis brandtii]|uniref:C-X-C motif chemokine 16 n=1 Tax=Myotis brandtii TaxID=109478 RepID=S7NMZ2_MYOBR|nr:PREDICTED: C-X-C motif chemokine 16 [Myotis brandtii]EPQ17855.1 C-X-C motif chemokine 16 [Myotis brandtii]